VLQELLQNSKKNVHETINVKHEYIEFLQHTDVRRDLKIYYPDLVASIGHKYGKIDLKGPASQVVDATVIINEQLHRICEKQLTLSQSTLIWNIVAKNRWNEYFTRQLGKENIKAKVSRTLDTNSYDRYDIARSQMDIYIYMQTFLPTTGVSDTIFNKHKVFLVLHILNFFATTRKRTRILLNICSPACDGLRRLHPFDFLTKPVSSGGHYEGGAGAAGKAPRQ
jgi:hypothetical protein